MPSPPSCVARGQLSARRASGSGTHGEHKIEKVWALGAHLVGPVAQLAFFLVMVVRMRTTVVRRPAPVLRRVRRIPLQSLAELAERSHLLQRRVEDGGTGQ